MKYFHSRMFPALRISFTGLLPDEKYMIMLDVVPVDSKRHRYSYPDSAWYVAGEADPAPPKRVHVHPESPFTGDQLMNHTVSFEKVKLTNNRADKNGNVSGLNEKEYLKFHLCFSLNHSPLSLGKNDKVN